MRQRTRHLDEFSIPDGFHIVLLPFIGFPMRKLNHLLSPMHGVCQRFLAYRGEAHAQFGRSFNCMAFRLQSFRLCRRPAGDLFKQAAIVTNHAPVRRDARFASSRVFRSRFRDNAHEHSGDHGAGTARAARASSLRIWPYVISLPRGTLRISASRSSMLGISMVPLPNLACILGGIFTIFASRAVSIFSRQDFRVFTPALKTAVANPSDPRCGCDPTVS